jgi:RNA polymerase sigma factor for flagellar operon FliA
MPIATTTPTPRRRKNRLSATVERRNEVVTRYYHCVEKVARHLARRLPPTADLNDLMSAGALGLLEAAARFDPSRGESFEAFARIRIRGAMLDDIRLRDTMSRDMRRAWRVVTRSTARLSQQLGRRPTEEEIAGDAGMSVEALRARRSQWSGARVIGIEDAGADLLERLPDEGAEDPQELVARRQLIDRLAEQIRALPERMQQVLSLYYRENLTLKEIGVVLGVSECRVCQIHGEAMRRLRAAAHGEARDDGREAA